MSSQAVKQKKKAALKDTPAPLIRGRCFTIAGLAHVLGVGTNWIYRRTQKSAKNPIPHCSGIGVLRFNPCDASLQSWVQSNFGPIDLEAAFRELLDGGNTNA
jgi:hypothetical protein